MDKMLSHYIAVEYVTLKSFKLHQLSMMGRSKVILTIYADIHDEQVWYLCIIIRIIITYYPIIVDFCRK